MNHLGDYDVIVIGAGHSPAPARWEMMLTNITAFDDNFTAVFISRVDDLLHG